MKKRIKVILGITAGNALVAFTVGAFIVPHGIIMGGVTGMALTINTFLPVEPAIIILFANLLMFLLGFVVHGKEFALNTLASSLLYPFLLGVVQRIPGIENLTDNSMLAAVYGGALLGIGIGIVLKVGGSTGGTDILALSLNKWFHAPVAICLYCIDAVILSGQILFSNSEQVLLGIFALVIETVLLNKVILIGKAQIQLFVISEKHEEIKEKILKQLEAGTSLVHIETGYTGEQQKAVLCVIPNRKLYAVKEMIQGLDPQAFITVSQINEVRGEGFTAERKH